jgi:hypothetical protein
MAETQICTSEKISPPLKEYTLDIQKDEVEDMAQIYLKLT